MSIFSRLWRYVHTNGYPISSSYSPLSAKSSRRREKNNRAPRLETMEQRILMTTLSGGQSFIYTDAGGNTVLTTLNGTVSAELIAATQAGDGSLVFGDISGKLGDGTVVGNGTTELNGGMGSSATGITPVEGIASNSAGNTYGFQLVSTAASGTNTTATTSISLVTVTPGTGITNSISLDFAVNSAIPFATATNTSVVGAAFNPLDSQNPLYFIVGYTPASTGSGTTTTGIFYELFKVDPTTGNTVDVGSMGSATSATSGNIGAMAFQSTGSNSALMWVYRNSAATTGTTATNPSLTAYNVGSTGTVNITTPAKSISLTREGFAPSTSGTAVSALNGITGLVSLPSDLPNASGNYLFAVVSGTTGTHLTRIDLNTGLATNFGTTLDLREDASVTIKDGTTLVGLTYDPTLYNPDTGTYGALLSVDSGTGNLLNVNYKLHVTQGDVYEVYTNNADMNASITFQHITIGTNSTTSDIYSGSIGSFFPTTVSNYTFALPTSGALYLGYRGFTSTSSTATGGHAFLTGQMDGSVGIVPGGVFSSNGSGGNTYDQSTNILYAGLNVGNSLEDGSQTLFSPSDAGIVLGLAISNDQTVTTVVASASGDVVSGSNVFYVDGDGNDVSLSGLEALAYGNYNLSSTSAETLYAVYDLHDGNGPTLGTLDADTGLFTVIGSLQLGQYAKVTGIAFGGHTSDGLHQAMYVLADTNAIDGATGSNLYQVNPTTGAVTTTIAAIQDPNGDTFQVGGATFDAAGDLLVFDKNGGRLFDVNVSTGATGANVSTAVGTISPTVGGIALDPNSGSIYAVDNRDVISGSTTTAQAVVIKDFTVAGNSAVNLGRFLFDGAVTGKVTISGSMDTFYAGWLITGDATGASSGAIHLGGGWISAGNGSNFGRTTTATDGTVDFSANFSVGGDIHNILSLASMGTDGSNDGNLQSDQPDYATGLEIVVGGKIGEIQTDGMFFGTVSAANSSTVPVISDGNATTPIPQNEIQTWSTNASTALGDFAAGNVTSVGSNAPFSNNSFNTPQYLGSIGNSTAGQPDVIDLQGTIQYLLPARQNPTDFYGLSLLAGQSVTIQVQSLSSLNTLYFAIYDPSGKMIASDVSVLDAAHVLNQAITITAAMAGTYRIEVATPGFIDGFGTVVFQEVPYELTVKSVGKNPNGTPTNNLNYAIGALVAQGSIYFGGALYDPFIGSQTSISAGSGDIGAIVGGEKPGSTGGNWIYSLGGLQDVVTSSGNLRVMSASSIGQNADGGANFAPDLAINGSIGLLQTYGTADILAVTTTTPVTGNIQQMQSANELAGIYQVDGGIGTIKAASMTKGSAVTVFHVNFDNTGQDGVIDLIQVSGDFGALGPGGPSIITGVGGDVRFIVVGGTVYQDNFFGGNETLAGIPPTAGADGTVTLTDDSGAKLTLTPGLIITTTTTTDPLTGTTTTTSTTTNGIINSLVTYGIEGSGGVVVVSVGSSSGLTINNSTGANAEIGVIDVDGEGIALQTTVVTQVVSGNTVTTTTTVNGVVTTTTTTTNSRGLKNGVTTTTTSTAPTSNTVDALGNTTAVLQTVAITGGHTDVWSITNAAGGVVDSVSNSTGGDILHANLTNQVGTFSTSGSIGVDYSHVVPSINLVGPNDVTSPAGWDGVVITGTVGSINAGKSIGNVEVTGSINSINANTSGNTLATVFNGITDPILINGTINNVNVGNGILSGGTGSFLGAGIYATGTIGSVNGGNGEIRGNIVSLGAGGIGNITMSNGSILGATILAVQSFTTAEHTGAGGVSGTGQDIGNVTISGNGGILGSYFVAYDIGNVLVGTNGFGVLDSAFITPGAGAIGNITAGGYGLRDDIFNSGNLGNLTATGNGTFIPLTAYDPGAQPSVNGDFTLGAASVTQVTSRLTDLAIYINGSTDGLATADPAGTLTGTIENIQATGSLNLGNVTAYTLIGSYIAYANSTGTIKITNGIDVYLAPTNSVEVPPVTQATATGTTIVTGSLAGMSVGGNVTDLDLEVAGHIGNIMIGGSVLNYTGTNQLVGQSLILAKGSSGTIASVTVVGSFTGTLTADSSIGTITIGAPNNTGASSGDFSGTINILGEGVTGLVLTTLNLYGSLTGGSLDIDGSVGTINIAHDLNVASLVINGNLNALNVGTDKFVNGSILAGNLVIYGDLGNLTVTGSVTGTIAVGGDVTSFNLVADSATSGGNLLLSTAALKAQGTIGSISVTNGTVAGAIVGGSGVTKATITNGNLDGTITSSLGSIGSVTITNGVLNGSILASSGTIGSITTGTMAASSSVKAQTLTKLQVNGDDAGSIVVSGNLASATITGALAATAFIEAGWLTALKTTGDMLGTVESGVPTTTTGKAGKITLTSGGSLGGSYSYASPVTITVAKNMLAGTIITDTGSLTSLKVGGTITGQILVDGSIGTITGATMGNAVITAGTGLTSITVKGAVSNTLLNVGLARGSDHSFGTADSGENSQMADVKTITVGSLSNSVLAIGGNLTTFKSTSTVTNSSVSTGLVLGGTEVAAVLADTTPLQDTTELNAARMGATLLHGNFSTASAGGTGLVSSALTAGVSPGADGAFGTADDNTSSSLTGGVSAFKSVKAVADSNSFVLAASTSGKTSATILGYTLDGSTNSIVSGDPVAGTPTYTATQTTPLTITVGGNTITITVKGKNGSVSVYDDTSTTNVLDTLVVNGTGLSITITSSAPGTLDIGRVLATAGSTVSSFVTNAFLVGNGDGGPQLWINSDVKTFSVAGFATNGVTTDGTWTGQIGGNVTSMSIGTQGPGRLYVGGKVTTLSVTNSLGNTLATQLGVVSGVGTITELATNSSGTTYAFANGYIFTLNPTTGATGTAVQVTTATGAAVSITGLDVNSAGTLFGVGTVTDLTPTVTVGSTATGGDVLKGLAVSPSGVVYAIDSSSGFDTLVTFDPTTGKETTVGVLRDTFGDTFSNNTLALTFTTDGTLLAIVNDPDGSAGNFTSGSAMAVLKIATTATSGYVRVSNPSSTGNALGAVLLKLGGSNVTNPYSALIIGTTFGSDIYTLYGVRRVGSTDVLDRIDITGAGTGVAATVTAIGTISVSVNGVTTNTTIVGLGKDSSGNIIGLDENGAGGDLVVVNTTTPGSSKLLTGYDLLSSSLSSFTLSGSTSYAYTTNSTTGGTFYTNAGVSSVLGTVDSTTGQFLQLSSLAQDSSGTPLAGTVVGLAVQPSTGDVFVITSEGVLAEYSGTTGALIQVIGTVIDSTTGSALLITDITFGPDGSLIGLNSAYNRLVKISTDSSSRVVDGLTQPIALAVPLTGVGTANAMDITTIDYSTTLGAYLAFSSSTSSVLELHGTTEASLGGIIANTYTNVNVAGSFGGRIVANGVGTTITKLTIASGSTFTGDITTNGSVGTLSFTGTLSGTVAAGGDLKTGSIGTIASDGTLSIGGTIASLTVSSLAGSLLAGSATKLTIGSIAATGIVEVIGAVATFGVTGEDDGKVNIGSGTTISVGTLGGTAYFLVEGAVASVALGSVAASAKFLVDDAVTKSLTVSGTLSGLVSTRRSVAAVTLGTVTNGILDIGGNITTLTVNGTVDDSVISAGTWAGFDGQYNTADDVIYGGSITTATFKGAYIDSILAAGVLPREGVASTTANNLPTDLRAYLGNPTAAAVEDVSSAEAGGIAVSRIKTLTFSQPQVVSSSASTGLLSGVVTADGVTTVKGGAGLTQVKLNNPLGAPSVISVTRTALATIQIVFSEQMNTATFDASTITVLDVNGKKVTNYTLSYTTQTTADGTVQGILTISNTASFGGSGTVTVSLTSGITNHTGSRSSLLDFNQDGTADSAGDPFGNVLPAGTFTAFI